MIARPKISRNEWKPAERGAFEVANFALLSCPGGDRRSVWACLVCGTLGCGRYAREHAKGHYAATRHGFALELETGRIWDYVEDRYAHRVDDDDVAASGAPCGGCGPAAPADRKFGALADHAPKDADVLVVGCGNSQLSEELATRGWDPARIVSVDFSASSIEQAACRARERAHSDERLAALRFCVADCRSLHENFPAASFDCAVDKGG